MSDNSVRPIRTATRISTTPNATTRASTDGETTQRHQVFISYSRTDSAWMRDIRNHIDRLPNFKIDSWIDRERLSAGDDIDAGVLEGIQASTIALLLVSENFIESDYIQGQELKWILEREQSGELTVIYVPIYAEGRESAVKTFLDSLGLRRRLSAISFDEPLRPDHGRADPGAGESQVKQVVDGIHRIVDPHVCRLEQCLQSRYRIIGRIAEGESAIVYRATDESSRNDVAIKMLKTPDDLSWFQRALTKATYADNIANIVPIYEHHFRSSISYCILKFIEGERLTKYIENTSPISIEFTREVVVKLAVAVARVREEKVFRHVVFNIRPENILIEHDTLEPYLSLAGRTENRRGLSHLKSLRDSGTREDSEAWSYVVPEYVLAQHEEPSLEAADQYLLGLTAFQMLQGRIPPRVVSTSTPLVPEFRDLPNVAANRGFSHILPVMRKMTNLDPQLRFGSLAEAVAALKRPELHSLQLVESSYRRCTGSGVEADQFFNDFYQRFLQRSDEAKQLFKAKRYSVTFKDAGYCGKRWQRQRKILCHAVLLCLRYFEDQHTRSVHEPNILSFNRDKHADAGIRASAATYADFMTALLETVEENDPLLSSSNASDLLWRDMWDAVMRPGLDYMQSCPASV